MVGLLFTSLSSSLILSLSLSLSHTHTHTHTHAHTRTHTHSHTFISTHSEVEILYGGPNIFDYEVKHASIHDIILAVISLGLVLFLAFFMSGFSFWLTVVVLYTIASSFPIAFFVYTKIFGRYLWLFLDQTNFNDCQYCLVAVQNIIVVRVPMHSIPSLVLGLST